MTTQQLCIGYRLRGKPERVIAEDLNLALAPGELICLLGPNGAGKSTLMRTLSGVQPPLAGQILVQGRSLRRMHSRDIARLLSVVLTERSAVGNLDVRTLVSMGRYPYTGWLGRLQATDEAIVDWALEATGADALAGRQLVRLSDGEQQKVMIARALAQDTPIILLDEPTAHLDLPNRIEIIRLLRRLSRETGKAILLTTHELDLALQGADKIWLIHPEHPLQSGVPEDLVLDGTFEDTFRREGFHFDRKSGSFRLHDQPQHRIALQGAGVAAYWTRRALEREGFEVLKTPAETAPLLRCETNGKAYHWQFRDKQQEETFHKMEPLLAFLRSQYRRK